MQLKTLFHAEHSYWLILQQKLIILITFSCMPLKSANMPGLKPGIPWFVARCLIHWTTRPKSSFKILYINNSLLSCQVICINTFREQLVMTKLIKSRILTILKLSEVGHGKNNGPQMFYRRASLKNYTKVRKITYDGALFSVIF